MMSALIGGGVWEFLAKATVVLGLGWCAWAALARVNPRWRVLCLRLMTVVVIVVPLAMVWVPAIEVDVVGSGAEVDSVEGLFAVPQPGAKASMSDVSDSSGSAFLPDVVVPSRKTRGIDKGVLLLAVYTFVTLILLGRLTIAHRRLAKVILETAPAPEEMQREFEAVLRGLDCERIAAVRLADGISAPYLTGIARPTLLVPRALADSERVADLRAVFLHEATHMASNDLPWSLAIHLVSAALWFHPLAWRLSNAHAASCESIADAMAAEEMKDRVGYSRLLARIAVELVANPPAAAGIPMARISEISRRLSLLKRGVTAFPLRRRSLLLSTTVMLFAATLTGGLRLVEAKQASLPTPAKAAENVQRATLQSRIDETEPGGVVELGEGVYQEPVTISKPIVLRGVSAKNTRIKLLADEPAIMIRDAKDVRIENLTVVWGLKSTDARIANPAAIYVRDADAILAGVHLQPYDRPNETPSGLTAAGRSKVDFQDGSSEGFAYAILYTDGAEGTVSSSILTRSAHSVVTQHEGTKVGIYDNFLGFCGYHAVRNTGGEMTMRNNVVANDRRAGAYLGNKPAHGVIENNLFVGSQGEIWGYYTSDVKIVHNLFLNSNGAGVGMWDTCSLDIESNCFIGNVSGVSVNTGKGTPGSSRIDGNRFWRNEKNFVDVAADPNMSEGDPGFADPAAGDFSTSTGMKEGLSDPAAIKVVYTRWLEGGGDALDLSVSAK